MSPAPRLISSGARLRGRLSKIDRLPPAADAVIARAIEALKEQRLTQQAIRDRMNAELARLGIAHEISGSAFHRWATDGLTNGFPPRAAPQAAQSLSCPVCGAALTVTLNDREAR